MTWIRSLFLDSVSSQAPTRPARSRQPSRRPSRRDRRKQETRDRIREAAVGLFASQGYDATKVAEICEEADVARQTFFNHFPTKRDLIIELFDIGLAFQTALVDSACERGATTRERLRLWFEGSVAAAVDAGPFARDLVAHVVQAFDENAPSHRATHVSGLARTVVSRGLELGDVTRRRDPDLLAELVEGGLVILVRSWTTRGGFDPVERAGELADVVADALERRPGEGSDRA